MKKLILKGFAVTAIIASLVSCESYDFGSTSDNLNNPSDPLPPSLLTGAQGSLSGALSLNSTATPSLYVQHLSQTQYTEESRYQTINFNWNITGSGADPTKPEATVSLYNKPLQALKTIIDINSDPTTKEAMAAYGSNNNQIAVAKIMWAYYFQWMTDRWGMLPYTEAFGGVQQPYPKYDSQESIYKDLFDKIDEAVAQMDGGSGPDGDIIFNGNMSQWKKFANTLKMNMAIRLAKVYPSPTGYAATKFNEAMGGAISSVSENIMYPCIDNDSFDNPYQDDYVDAGRTDECLSDVLVDKMLATNDPRLPMFGEPAESSGTFVGLQYGWADAGSIPNADVSFMNNDLILESTTSLPMFTYAQIAFNKAEAVLLGWIPGNAQTYYEEAILASMEQWEVEPIRIDEIPQPDGTILEVEVDVYDEYLNRPEVTFDAANAMNQIAEQKWLALFYQPYEAWAEWRRLDYPVLTPAVDALTGNSIPVRHAYPSNEPTQNKVGYDAAVAAQGTDDLFTKLWWDK
ncbi:SusD/RagB family nutrient-binding outer membrane lipoprotein [Tenacibaculum tangerinum]|uniref:SusD/RagB family nutrient-binding outer membrane lipoprotein n=1 Tax=Tenacibaculum tangerinum TaxID=3038772 RepID=A0ABY8L4Z2_9FLAO|nr:SusD/RagB family nutrient-binding outer membrane lipoprotein [Tenacibaculum tangerinum]WGH75423.1 SusD/RagB family nutrient-binding outer membrane lipoprotein [Tenacibaculum tangerinum]